MKLKKILASLTAAAMAVTTMAFAPVSVSAATIDVPEGTETVLGTFALNSSDQNPMDAWGSVWVGLYGIDSSYFDDENNYVKTVFEYDDAPLIGDNNDVMSAVATWGFKNYSGWYNPGKFYDGSIKSAQPLAPATTSTDTTFYFYLPISDFTSGDKIEGNVQNNSTLTGVTLKSVELVNISSEPEPYEGDIIELPKNTWDGGWNWQGFYTVPQDQFTSGMTINQVLDKTSTVKVSFKVNGAASGTNLDYDMSQISWKIRVSCHHKSNNNDWPWIVGGLYSYENGIVTVTADISSITDEKYNNTNYLFDSIDLVAAADSSTAEEKIKVYYEDMKVSFEKTVPATKVTVTPETLELIEGGKGTITAKAEPSNTTDIITFSSSDPDVAVVGAASGEVTAIAEGTAVITAKANDDVFTTCTVTVKKAAQPVIISVNDSTYGTASPDKDEAAEGEKVTISAEPKDGYQFDNWEVISGDVTLADAESAGTSFTMPASEVEIQAVFSEIPAGSYAVVVKAADGGSAKASAKSAVAGTEITLTATPDEGYAFDKWVVSPATLVIENNTFTMPEEAVTITPVFGKINYTVEVDVTEGGTASTDKSTAQMGDTVKITAVPEDGYVLDSITVNGTAISGTSFTMPAGNVLVSVSFKAEGSAGVNVEAPDGVSIGFAGDVENVLAAIFGEDYAALIEAGNKLDVVMTVKDETAVSDDDKALIKDSLEDGQQVGLILDVALIKTVNGVSETIANAKNPVSFIISVPDSIIAENRDYSVVRVHGGKAENIGGTFDRAAKAITVSSDKFSTYAIVYEESEEIEDEPVVPAPVPVIKYYNIVSDSHSSVSVGSASAGTTVYVNADFGYDANVYCGSQLVTRITDSGSFAMPSGNVRIVCRENGYLAMVRTAARNSYIFVYDADMNYIKTNGSVKGINGEGRITVKLGEEYSGMTVTLYKGRKSTNVKLDSKTLDNNGNATFTVEGGKNYTAVVE